MSYDSANGRDRAQGDLAGSAPGVAPGKRSETDRLSAPQTGTTMPASTGKAHAATMLGGTAWLHGVLGFVGDDSELSVRSVGNDDPPLAVPQPAPAAPGVPGAPAPGAPGAPVPGAPAPPLPPLTITSATTNAAPGGAAATRTTVAVGEVVTFTGSAAGTWAATLGTAAGPSATTFAWTAPGAPGTAVITLTSGGRTQTISMTVIAPTSLAMARASVNAYAAGTQGVGMITNVTIGPNTVSFGNVEWLEEPGPASAIRGYYLQFNAADLEHHPNTNWADGRFNAANTGPQDEAAQTGAPRPWSAGSFTWAIPNRYRVAGTGGGGTVFTTTYQVFTMTGPTGETTITKGGASVARTP